MIASLTDKKKETSAEKSRIYKARKEQELFTAADEMENLKPAEQSYRLGDTFFEDEHRKWWHWSGNYRHRDIRLRKCRL